MNKYSGFLSPGGELKRGEEADVLAPLLCQVPMGWSSPMLGTLATYIDGQGPLPPEKFGREGNPTTAI